MKYSYIQGEFVADENAVVSIHDRGFKFGDGIFETIRLENGGLYNFDFHLNRIRNGLEFFKLKFDPSGLKKICLELAEKNDTKKGFVRIAISRGKGSKGYMPIESTPTLVIESTAFGDLITQGKLSISSYKAPAFAPCKTMNSAVYSLSLLEASERGCQNSVLTDTNGYICECASGNIFWVRNNVLFTPEDGLAFISGSIRSKIFSLYNSQIVTGKFKVSSLSDADEVFMTNVNCLVMPFTEAPSLRKKYKSDKTHKILELIKADIKNELG